MTRRALEAEQVCSNLAFADFPTRSKRVWLACRHALRLRTNSDLSSARCCDDQISSRGLYLLPLTQARRQREEAEAKEALRRQVQRERELEEQIRADAERQRAERARKTRERSESDATETGAIGVATPAGSGVGTSPSSPVEDGIGTQVVTFPEEIVWEGVRFSHVKLFQSHKGLSLLDKSSSSIANAI